MNTISPQLLGYLIAVPFFIYVIYQSFSWLFDITVISLLPISYQFTGTLSNSMLKMSIFVLTCFLVGCLLMWSREKNVPD